MTPLRIGIAGCGGICRQRHIPGLRKIDGVEIVTVANRSRDSSQKAAAELGIPETDESWEAVVARDDLDAVLIGTWPYLHKDISVAALERGKHVFCQARMAMNYKEAQQMYDAWRRSGRVAMLCPVPFGLSIDRSMARLQREGYLGQVRLIKVESYTDAYASPGAPMNWRKDDRLSGLNMHTLGMYIEVVHRWFGWTKSIAAQTSIFTPVRRDESGAQVEVSIPDEVLAHGRMRSGDIPVQYTVCAAVHHGKEQIMIYGERATLRYDIAEDVLYGARPKEQLERLEIHPDEVYDVRNWRVERDFVDAIRNNGEYHPNFEDGLRYMQVIQAIYDSASRQRSVELA